MTLAELKEARLELVETMLACEGGFPGSKEYRAESEAMQALADFDAAHPEVYAAAMEDLAAERGPINPWI
jgi:hypothetical protein